MPCQQPDPKAGENALDLLFPEAVQKRFPMKVFDAFRLSFDAVLRNKKMAANGIFFRKSPETVCVPVAHA
jgi:hypothetical protein